MAIDIEPTKKEKPKGKNSLLIILVLILILSFVAYFFLAYVLMPQKEAEMKELEASIAGLNATAVKENINELNKAKTYIADFRTLFINSPKVSNFLESFQKWSHPAIKYSNIRIETDNRKVTMSGKTPSNRNLMEQISTLDKEETIESYELSNIFMSETGETTFDLSLIIKPSLLAR